MARVRSGATLEEIATALGVSSSTAYMYLRRLGIEANTLPRPVRVDPRIATARAMVAQGAILDEIAEAIGMTTSGGASHFLKRHGIERNFPPEEPKVEIARELSAQGATLPQIAEAIGLRSGEGARLFLKRHGIERAPRK